VLHNFMSKSDNFFGISSGSFSSCIIDVGCAETGVIGKKYKKMFNLPCIYIDADQENLSELDHDSDDLVLLSAISNRCGIGKLNLYQSHTHSLLDTNLDEIHHYIDVFTGAPARKQDWKKKGTRFVPMLTLESLIETLDIKTIMALKIDCQGHDLAVVKGLGRYIENVLFIELEINVCKHEVYIGQSKKSDVLEFMGNNGFSLVGTDLQLSGQEENLIFQKIN
jgi:FkbM family methyltransferase